ncbi:gamma-glutamylcyclotransferase [Rhodovulum sp. YNF3179]|uniref:gamma-glutamylcyclotransferase n=1 Tax=Rhodovulum sp. YNF3179 TaxID=3425127 RepID=UPI003D32C549
MTDTHDPFAHHPELRARIKSPETSFFRDFTLDGMIAEHPHMEEFRAKFHTDAEREALRAKALAGREGDLWVFAYGSLMWDPALRFAEVRRAHLDGYARRFMLKDEGARGSKEAPGLMAALDRGEGCEGLAFRIREAEVGAETEILFRREMIGPAYLAKFVTVRLDETEVAALTFLANHASPDIDPQIPHSDQVRHIATGHGILGSNRDYLVNVVEHFAHLGIEDPHCSTLLRDVDAYLETHAVEPSP